MTCQACASRIEKVLNKKPYIQQAAVNFASEQAQISFDNSEHSPQDILQLIENVGFTGACNQNKRLLLWNLAYLRGVYGCYY